MTQTTKSLSFLDRFSLLWIAAAMTIGLILGKITPSLVDWLAEAKIVTISVPVAIGSPVMMYPPFAEVRYDKMGKILVSRKPMGITVFLNWILDPALIFTLAWILPSGSPELRTGAITVGLARCITIVLAWSDLSCGDTEVAAIPAAADSLFQIFMPGALGWFYLQILPFWLGLETTSASSPFRAVTLSVVAFLDIPFLAGTASCIIGERTRGRDWYESEYLSKTPPLALTGLLYTIVLLSAPQPQQVLESPQAVVEVVLPLVIYFLVIFMIAPVSAKVAGMNYAASVSIVFTVAGNNFELAIAVVVGTFGLLSQQALTGTIGPLIEISVLVALVYVIRWLRPRLFPNDLSIPDKLQKKDSEMKEIPKVLFICVVNAGKSRIAEATARAKYTTQFIALSAGTNSKTTTNALAAKLVAKIGASTDGVSPKPTDPTILRTVDRAIIIGDAAHVEFPSDAQGSLERWFTNEPSKRGIDGKERMDLIRDDLERRIDELAVEIRSTKNP